MKIQYDLRGYLKPYDKIPIMLEKIEDYFVRPFPSSSTWTLLLEQFMAFADKLNRAIDRPLVIWIDGSFVTLKQNPNDIDLVVFIENEVIKSKYKTIREHFFDKKNLKERGLDVYYAGYFKKNIRTTANTCQTICIGIVGSQKPEKPNNSKDILKGSSN